MSGSRQVFGMFVAVEVGVVVAVGVCVFVGVFVGVAVGVNVLVEVAVGVGVNVAVNVGVLVGGGSTMLVPSSSVAMATGVSKGNSGNASALTTFVITVPAGIVVNGCR